MKATKRGPNEHHLDDNAQQDLVRTCRTSGCTRTWTHDPEKKAHNHCYTCRALGKEWVFLRSNFASHLKSLSKEEETKSSEDGTPVPAQGPSSTTEEKAGDEDGFKKDAPIQHKDDPECDCDACILSNPLFWPILLAYWGCLALMAFICFKILMWMVYYLGVAFVLLVDGLNIIADCIR